ncbi:MAG TPA: TIM-barrel domain-containing protein, partial [Spirochaetota bacterium]|nr:TIM-barrel domain-containing protein [Spirochaetota bacterium]
MTVDKTIRVNSKKRVIKLGKGCYRFEYAPGSIFEERASFRAWSAPSPRAFQKVLKSGKTVKIIDSGLIINIKNDQKKFTKTNLRITDKNKKPVWQPGQTDNENLGGVHLGLDYMHRALIPKGVHPATTAYHDNSNRWLYWRYLMDADKSPLTAANYRAKGLDEIIAETPAGKLPAYIKNILKERAKFPPGFLSRSGYFLYNDSGQPVIDPKQDWPVARRQTAENQDLYFTYYGQDFKKGLKDYQTLFGKCNMLPRYTLGLWYSRYPTFKEDKLRQCVAEFEKYKLPLDMLVLDLEWHKHGWCGWDWDKRHIFQPQRFLDFLKKKKIHITLNTHPNAIPVKDSRFKKFMKAAGLDYEKAVKPGQSEFEDFDLADKKQADAYMNVLHKPVQDQGIDFWWIDGAAPLHKEKSFEHQFMTGHVYYDHIKKNYPEIRPTVFTRAPGLGAHRYGINFTGDTWAHWEVLANQVEHTLRAGH